ncbi:hypothetical protein [Streptomyces noursei]|uniref:hypothetical protein n=1 Tax=Streptomyces noursei TaxID=1971 RepID=UPI0030F032AF
MRTVHPARHPWLASGFRLLAAESAEQGATEAERIHAEQSQTKQLGTELVEQAGAIPIGAPLVAMAPFAVTPLDAPRANVARARTIAVTTALIAPVMPPTVNPPAAIPRADTTRADTTRADATRADATRAEPIAVITALIAPIVPPAVNPLPITPRTNVPRAKTVIITTTAPRVTPVVPSIAAVVTAHPHGPALRVTLGRAGERGGHHDGKRRSGKRTAYVRMHRVFSWSAGNRARDVYLCTPDFTQARLLPTPSAGKVAPSVALCRGQGAQDPPEGRQRIFLPRIATVLAAVVRNQRCHAGTGSSAR